MAIIVPLIDFLRHYNLIYTISKNLFENSDKGDTFVLQKLSTNLLASIWALKISSNWLQLSVMLMKLYTYSKSFLKLYLLFFVYIFFPHWESWQYVTAQQIKNECSSVDNRSCPLLVYMVQSCNAFLYRLCLSVAGLFLIIL